MFAWIVTHREHISLYLQKRRTTWGRETPMMMIMMSISKCELSCVDSISDTETHKNQNQNPLFVSRMRGWQHLRQNISCTTTEPVIKYCLLSVRRRDRKECNCSNSPDRYFCRLCSDPVVSSSVIVIYREKRNHHRQRKEYGISETKGNRRREMNRDSREERNPWRQPCKENCRNFRTTAVLKRTLLLLSSLWEEKVIPFTWMTTFLRFHSFMLRERKRESEWTCDARESPFWGREFSPASQDKGICTFFFSLCNLINTRDFGKRFSWKVTIFHRIAVVYFSGVRFV